jgi:hypothetical protein
MTMRPIGKVRQSLINRLGAAAGSMVGGCCDFNLGLRVQVLENQPRDHDGPLFGRFIIADVGTNANSACLRFLLNRETDANEVLSAIRHEHPTRISVVNARNLVLVSSSSDLAGAALSGAGSPGSRPG